MIHETSVFVLQSLSFLQNLEATGVTARNSLTKYTNGLVKSKLKKREHKQETNSFVIRGYSVHTYHYYYFHYHLHRIFIILIYDERV